MSISVAKNQIDLYDALAGALSPKMKPNELIGVRVVDSEGPLKGQLELKFEHDLPDGTNTFIDALPHAQGSPHVPGPMSDHGNMKTTLSHAHTQYGHTCTALAHRNVNTVSGRARSRY